VAVDLELAMKLPRLDEMVGEPRYAIIGDVHGAADQLEQLLGQEQAFRDRKVVFLGDYVDIGEESRPVISLLRQFAGLVPDATFLCGNHDFFMRDFLQRGDFVYYASQGGLSTIRSYVGTAYGNVHQQFRDSVPFEHQQFLNELKPFFETEEYLFSHCGFSPSQPLDRSFDAMVLASHQDLFAPKTFSRKIAVFGHYFQRNRLPWVGRGLICLDTGCGSQGGPLTALLLPERHFMSVGADLSIKVTHYDER
jgi:serine/threonine protein phosphatase 1